MTDREARLSRGELKALLLSDDDGFRKVFQTVVQEALEAEMAEALGPRKASGLRISQKPDRGSANSRTVVSLMSGQSGGVGPWVPCCVHG